MPKRKVHTKSAFAFRLVLAKQPLSQKKMTCETGVAFWEQGLIRVQNYDYNTIKITAIASVSFKNHLGLVFLITSEKKKPKTKNKVKPPSTWLSSGNKRAFLCHYSPQRSTSATCFSMSSVSLFCLRHWVVLNAFSHFVFLETKTCVGFYHLNRVLPLPPFGSSWPRVAPKVQAVGNIVGNVVEAQHGGRTEDVCFGLLQLLLLNPNFSFLPFTWLSKTNTTQGED